MAATFTDEGMKLYWFPIGSTIAGTRAALKVADFSAVGVKNLSDYAIVGGCEFVAADPDTIDQKVYSDKGKVTVPTLDNYTGRGQFRRDRDPSTKVPTANDALSIFQNRAKGYIVKRLGIPEATSIAATQDYEYFLLTATRISTINDADGGYETLEVGFLQAGDHGFGAVVS